LRKITIGPTVISLSRLAFEACTLLRTALFEGNAPTSASDVFLGADQATVYYLPGAIGWGSFFGGRPALLWNPDIVANDSAFGIRTNSFNFRITGSSNLVVVIEACTNLVNAPWMPVQTNTLNDGSSFFSDALREDVPNRFYRIRDP